MNAELRLRNRMATPLHIMASNAMAACIGTLVHSI
jgi:hypothetical protein